ncbi:PREDICTED: uncharacterized protein LOC103343679 [Prunus mume]|uniref:Uncharacterized protein LOC103343679 n=1 Tax=Prunus mume TaxID=102107 RepID=A0ABM1LYZ8_PRUMU|nr:PREDICTED: uncharacterized protein LOC103343679 [Prunus mume]
MGSNVELVWPESEAYSSRVNNCSHANSALAVIRAKLSAEQLEQFKTSCFGHLLNIDKIQFSGQIVHGVVLRRVAGQGVKDLDGLSFLIGCDVAQFTRQDFCLISGLRFGEVPEVSSGESDEIRLQKRYFIDEGITCNALEEAFMRCTEEDDIYKLALVYFAELVVLGRDKHLNINLNYLTLVEDLDAFNRYPWGSVSFDKTQDSLFSAPTKYVKSFENEEGRGKGKSKVTGTRRRNEKGKKDNHGEVQKGDWSFKGFTYAFQNHIHTCFADNKRKKEQVGWKIRTSLVNVVNGKVPACGLDWQNTYKVYVPCMLQKYKHWVALEIDLIQCEIKVYDSMVSLIPDQSLKEELGPLSITIPNLLHTLDFYEEGVYANECTRDWWCPWPIHRVDVPQQANQGDCGMFVLKYIELLSAEIPLATCTSQNMPFFRLKLAAEIARGDAYKP